MMIMRANTEALVRRLADARRRRHVILNRRTMSGRLPDWAREPLLLLGMSAAELDELISDGPELECRGEAAEAEHELRAIDTCIEQLEAELLSSSCSSLGEVQAVLDLTLVYATADSAPSVPIGVDELDVSRVSGFLQIAADSLRGLLAADLRLPS